MTAVTKENIIKLIKIASPFIILVVLALTALVRYVIPAYRNAENLGVGIGDKAGTIVGNVTGSFDGITTGLEKGVANGKEEGLSAKDTESEIKNHFSQIGNLEVMEAGVKLTNVNKIGKKDDYAALFMLKGVAVFSVDLRDVEINDIDTNTIEVLLPEIDAEIYIDEGATEKLAEYQKKSWTGSAKDGFTEYMNTRAETDQSVKETMENYSTLMETARSAAIKQIDIIANAATGNRKEITVRFKEEGQADE